MSHSGNLSFFFCPGGKVLASDWFAGRSSLAVTVTVHFAGGLSLAVTITAFFAEILSLPVTLIGSDQQ